MAPDDPSGARPAPVVLRIKLRYDDVEAMIQRFAANVGKTGLFLPTKSLQPIGAEIKFELRLATDQPVLVGLGRVKAVREPDPDNPKATFGMAVELMRVTRESRDLILKMLERRRQLGLPETGLPMPADIDAARRSDFIDTGIKDYASGAIPQPVPAADSSPIAPSASDALLTAPRRQTGPIAVAKVAHVEPLAPEPPRKRRVPVAELIASASGPVTTAAADDHLDDDAAAVDVAAVLARARTLAGSDLDHELEALRDAAAAPIEIGIEAASAELARQLGGAAVRRDRSGARWAPPPPTTNGERAPEPDAPVAADAAPSPAAEPPVAELSAATPPAAEPPVAELSAATPPAAELSAATPPVAEPPAAEAAAAMRDAPEPAPDFDRAATRDAREPAPTDIDALAHHMRERERWRERDEPGDDAVDDATPVSAVEPVVPAPDPDDDDALFEQRPSRRSFAPEAAAIETEPSSAGLIHDDADASQFEGEDNGAHEVDPEQIHDEIHRLDESDFEEVERTQIGQVPVDPDAFDQHAYATIPADDAALADRLDAQLAAAEDDDLGFSRTVDAALAGLRMESVPGVDAGMTSDLDAGMGAMHPDLQPSLEAGIDPGQFSGGFSLEEPMTAGDYMIPLGHREAGYEDPGNNAALEAALDAAVDEEEQIEEIDDFEILAEADAEDADLLASAAEQEVAAAGGDGAQGVEEGAFELPPARPSFLSRLALDDDSGYHVPPAAAQFDELSHEPGELEPGELESQLRSAGHALRAFDEPEEHSDFNVPGTFTPVPSDPYAQPVGEQSYTFAGDLPAADDFDEPHGNYGGGGSGGFVPPDAFDQSDVISIRPETPVRGARPVSVAVRLESEVSGGGGAGGEDFPDLESALEALDVDLDDLGAAPPGGRRRRSAPVVRAGRGRQPGAPESDDLPTARGRGGDAHIGSGPTEDARGVRQTGGGRVVTPSPAPKSGRVHKRATTEDGILIDFDDEDA